MKKAPAYAEWAKLAKELDEVVGNEKWKTEKQSPYFDHELIEQKTELFNHLMQTNDAEGLMWHLRKGLLRVRRHVHRRRGHSRAHTSMLVGLLWPAFCTHAHRGKAALGMPTCSPARTSAPSMWSRNTLTRYES